jgi:hypothetical protein
LSYFWHGSTLRVIPRQIVTAVPFDRVVPWIAESTQMSMFQESSTEMSIPIRENVR